MGYSATYDRIPLSVTVQEYLPLSSESGMLPPALSQELVERLNYCVEQMCHGRKESETLKRNEKNRLLSDVLDVLKETLGCVLSSGFAFKQSFGWKLAHLCLPSVHSTFELMHMFHDSLCQRCNEVEPHDIERMKRIIACLNQVFVQLSELVVELADIELLSRVMRTAPTGSSKSQADSVLYVYLADNSVPQLLTTQVMSHVTKAHKMCMSLQEFLIGLPLDSCKSSPTKLHEQIGGFLERFSADSVTALNRIKIFSKFSALIKRLCSITLIPLAFFEEAKAILQQILADLSPIFSALIAVLPTAPISTFVTEHAKYLAQVTEVIDTLTEQLAQCRVEEAATVSSIEWPYFALPFASVGEEGLSVEIIVDNAKKQVSAYMTAFSLRHFNLFYNALPVTLYLCLCCLRNCCVK